MASGSYRKVMGSPGVGWLLATSLVARLPVAMVNLAIILRVVHASGSYARAGEIAAAYVVGTGIGSPLLGRLADRVGRRPVLVGGGILNATGLVLLAVVPVRELALVFPLAATTGASLPPVAPAVRSLWRNLVDEDVLSHVYAVDATLQEVTFMIGPALVALVSALVSPAAALAASAAIGLVGTLAVSAQRATSLRPAPRDEATAGQRPRARSGGLLVLVAVTALLLLGIGVVEVVVVAFAGEHHAAHQAGLLLMVWSAGSFVGGLTIGGRVAAGGARAVVWLTAASSVGFALLAAAPAVGVLYPLLFVAGTAIAPGFSCIYSLVGRLAPEGAAVEAFSWVASAIQFGAAAGAAIGGVLAQSAGTRFAMLSAGAVGLVAVVVAFSGRRLLSARPAGVLHPAALD